MCVCVTVHQVRNLHSDLFGFTASGLREVVELHMRRTENTVGKHDHIHRDTSHVIMPTAGEESLLKDLQLRLLFHGMQYNR